MAHQIKLIDDLGVIVLKLSGRIAREELERTLDELPATPGFRPHLKLIADFRDCNTGMSGKDMQELASYARKTDASWGVTKWALLAPDDVIFGLSRMYMALTAEYQVETHVFRSVQGADDWLEIGVGVDEILGAVA